MLKIRFCKKEVMQNPFHAAPAAQSVPASRRSATGPIHADYATTRRRSATGTARTARLRHLLLALAAPLLLTLLLPAAVQAKVPDEDDIIDRTMDSSSPWYYTSLMMRYNVGDSTLNDTDYHYLYYGYAHQEEYKPLETNPDLDKLLLLASGLDPDQPAVETLEAIVAAGEASLRRDPFSPKVLNLLAYAYGSLGNKVQEKAYFNRMNGILRTINQSGDGLSQKSPRHILMFDHALDVLTADGLTYGKSRIISRTVEFVPLTVPYTVEGKKRKGLYFDFGRVYWNKPEGYTYQRDRTWQFNNLKPRTYK